MNKSQATPTADSASEHKPAIIFPAEESKRILLAWSDANCATGPSGTQYCIWSESYAGRHGDRMHRLMVWRDGKWDMVEGSWSMKKHSIKRLAEKLERNVNDEMSH